MPCQGRPRGGGPRRASLSELDTDDMILTPPPPAGAGEAVLTSDCQRQPEAQAQ